MTANVADGSLLLAVPIAVLAGLVSFASPCVLPLVPGYLGYVTGLQGADLENQRRFRMLAGAILFVTGFSTVFVLMGLFVGVVGEALYRYQDSISRVLGVFTIMLGLIFAGLAPKLSSSWRPSIRPTAGLIGAPLLGVVFGVSWTACYSPTLAAILALGMTSPDRGMLLAAAYCVGLGLPFLGAAVAYRRAVESFEVLRRHRVGIARFGGVLLVLIGMLLVTGAWTELMVWSRGSIASFESAI